MNGIHSFSKLLFTSLICGCNHFLQQVDGYLIVNVKAVYRNKNIAPRQNVAVWVFYWRVDSDYHHWTRTTFQSSVLWPEIRRSTLDLGDRAQYSEDCADSCAVLPCLGNLRVFSYIHISLFKLLLTQVVIVFSTFTSS